MTKPCKSGKWLQNAEVEDVLLERTILIYKYQSYFNTRMAKCNLLRITVSKKWSMCIYMRFGVSGFLSF